jgi:DNA-binding CsgD family transcriptional regulator
MHLKQYEEVSEARSLEELAERMLAFTHFVDFERFAIAVERPKAGGGKSYPNLTNTPSAFQSIQRDVSIAAVDPVHTHLRTSFKPILYTQKTYVDANVADLWELAAPHGYAVGAAVSIAVPGVGRLLLGVDRCGNLPNDPDKRARLVSDLQLLATYSQDTMTRLIAADDEPLTPHQLNVLKLMSQGKSNSVIGSLLGISENTVKFHVAGLFKRMNVATREQAVAEGCRQGLIT